MKLIPKEYLTFDDVLLIPQYCTIRSRQDVDTETRLTKNTKIGIPIITANMDTVTESDMMFAMHSLGGLGILHRFLTLENIDHEIRDFLISFSVDGPIPLMAASIGVNNNDELLQLYRDFGIKIICIDIAHGHCDRMISTIKKIKDFYPEADIIAGNVATRQGTRDLIEAGADAIKVGIGPGSRCSTRLVTGCGIPQLSAIIDCVDVANEYNIPIIADGGITKSGDIVKALAAGASSVMIGNLVAGTDETPGEILTINENGSILCGGKKNTYNPPGSKLVKQYRGMASRDAMNGWKGEKYHAAPEGESRMVKCKGSVIPIVQELVAGLRSGMTYCNAKNIEELQKNAIFRRVSANTLIENKPHGLL